MTALDVLLALAFSMVVGVLVWAGASAPRL